MSSTQMYLFPVLGVAVVILINGLYLLICLLLRKREQRLSVNQSNDLEGGHHRHHLTNRRVNDNPLAFLPVLAPCVIKVKAVADAVAYEGQEKMKFVNDECVICLAGFEDGEVCHVLVNCRHAYHGECIDHWIPRNTSCPICRVEAEIRVRVCMSGPSLT